MTPTCRNLKRRPESFTFFLDVQRREKLESFRPVSTFWCVLISDHHGIVFPAECLRPRPAGTRLTATCSLTSVGWERAPAADWHPAGSCLHGEFVEWNRRAIAACGPSPGRGPATPCERAAEFARALCAWNSGAKRPPSPPRRWRCSGAATRRIAASHSE